MRTHARTRLDVAVQDGGGVAGAHGEDDLRDVETRAHLRETVIRRALQEEWVGSA
jgi:hypothetical protein